MEEIESLVQKAAGVLRLSDDVSVTGVSLRAQLVAIATDKNLSPTVVHNRAHALLERHFGCAMASEFANATRSLAVIRRDYGMDALTAVIAHAR